MILFRDERLEALDMRHIDMKNTVNMISIVHGALRGQGKYKEIYICFVFMYVVSRYVFEIYLLWPGGVKQSKNIYMYTYT